MIAECIRSEDRRARKPRLQILAAKFDQEIDAETIEGLIAAGWTKKDIDWIRRKHGGPCCIRASSGHSDFGFARAAELCNILFPNMSERLGGAFHVTKPSALEGIILFLAAMTVREDWRYTSGYLRLGTARTSRPRPQCTMSKRETTSSPSICRQGSCQCTSQGSCREERLSPSRPSPSKREGRSGNSSP